MHDVSQIVKKLDQKILAHSGVNSYEEIIKLLFLKLYDELHSNNTTFNSSNFTTVNGVLKKANKQWPGIVDTPHFEVQQPTLSSCLELLKNVQLAKHHASAFDSAIEYLLPHTHRGSRGQFMTPRHIAEEVIKMIHPKANESLIDPACGSGGFLEYAILMQKNKKKYAEKKAFGMDYDDKMTRIARLICLKIASSKANISTSNSLTSKHKVKFDLVVSNPPYGGLISEESILNKFALAKNDRNKIKNTQRHILFIEKCMQLARPGGRIALILPQGVLNNGRMKQVHKLMFQKCRLVAVISLPQSTFMPHTNVKTSIVLLEKRKDKTLHDYKVFMAISKKSGKDKKGKLEYVNSKIDHDLKKIRSEFQKFKTSQRISW